MTYDERRKSERVAVKFKISYLHQGDYLFSLTKDLSADGMFIYTENPPDIGEILTLSFYLDSRLKINVEAKVVWVSQKNQSQDQGVGVRFIDTKSEHKEKILHFVNRIAILPNGGFSSEQ